MKWIVKRRQEPQTRKIMCSLLVIVKNDVLRTGFSSSNPTFKTVCDTSVQKALSLERNYDDLVLDRASSTTKAAIVAIETKLIRFVSSPV